jgi:7,8-dihydropterin-6-yl-methyl-4-(beta-D-ribofuranosyl)aminobenzene 5'-phosphate synthase
MKDEPSHPFLSKILNRKRLLGAHRELQGVLKIREFALNSNGVSKVHAIMGGFHLSGKFFEPIIKPTIEALKAIDPDYILPTHCTGRKAIMQIEAEMPGKFILNMSGTRITFSASS